MTEPAVANACIDACLALAMVAPDGATEAALERWAHLAKAGVTVYVPPLFFAETTSALRLKVHIGHLPPAEADRAFAMLARLAVHQWDPPDLQARAWNLAHRFRQPRAYDAQYLAVADALGCTLWTIDRRLAHAVGAPLVRLAG